jgi:hypothetical protein
MKPQVSDTPIKRAIALISDIHFGSIYAPMHVFVTHDKRKIIPSDGQEALNSIFKWCHKIMQYWNVDSVIFLGDIIQGKNIKDFGRELITTDLEEQQDLAIDYLKPLVKGLKVCGVSGTPYHKSVDTEIEKDIIEGLNGQFFDKMAWLNLKGTTRTLNVAHESAKATIYPLSALEREAVQLLKAHGEGKLPKLDIMARGHRHIFAHLHTVSYHAIYVPSFQVWYPFKTTYYGALQSDIGIAILFIDAKNRVIIHHYTANQTPKIGDKTHKF